MQIVLRDIVYKRTWCGVYKICCIIEDFQYYCTRIETICFIGPVRETVQVEHGDS